MKEPENYSINKPLKQAVHCKTQEEWDFILSKFNPNKLQSNSWDVYTKESCFSLQENCERDGYTSVRHFKLDEVKILSFQEWCDLNGYKMEKSKQEILKEFAEKYPPGTKVKSPDGIEFIISTTHKHKGENNDFLQSSPYYTGLLGEVLAVKENSCIGEYLYKDGKYAEIIKDTPKFEVGKWYKYNNWYLKYLKHDDKVFVASEYISDEKEYVKSVSNFVRSDKSRVLASIEEIQQYLPDGHPDKIKSNQEFKVGDWVVVLEEDGFYHNSEKCPQKLMEIGGYSLPYKLLFKDGHNNSYEKIRHATEEEMKEYFRKNEDLLKKEVSEGFKNFPQGLYYQVNKISTGAEIYKHFNEILDRMKGDTPKPSYHLLSVDDEELPMVNIIKTNTVKQLLNND